MSSESGEQQVSLGAVLLPAQRRQRIIELLHRYGAVTLQQLEQVLQVSISTLRRDLDGLADEGVIDRTHGGGLLRQQQYSTFEPDIAAASELSRVEKRMVGMCAAEALQAGQSVIFDSGSTVMEAARVAAARNIELFAVTNDLAIAQILGASKQIQIYVLGGHLRPGSNTLLGPSVLSALQSIKADVLLLGAHAVTAGVISETSPEVAAVKRALLNAASSRRLLVDSSKFRPRVFMSVCEAADVDELITDQAAPEDELAWFNRAGKTVRIALGSGF